MESPAPSVNILVVANDEEVDKVPLELFNSWLVSINANNTSLVWQYFAMVKDGPITCNGIQYVYCCLLCLKKHPGKFLDSLVTIYNGITGNAHKQIASTHPSFHLARKRQLFKPKQLISISTSTFVSANNIHAFIESNNDVVIKRVHGLITRLVVNCKVPLLHTINVDLNEVIQATSYLKPGSHVPMTPGKIDRVLISMFSKFTIWDSIIKQFFVVSVYWIDLQSWIRYKLALGLAVLDGHDAQAYNNAAMVILKHYGIRRNDIVLSINDTTNTSVATDRLIAEADDTFNMHLVNLTCDHAIGKRKRTFNKEIVDSFKECKDLRLAMRQMIGYVWNKKAKSRKINYKKRNKQIGYNVIKIDSQLVANASWPNVVKTKIIAMQMSYSIVNVMPSSRSARYKDNVNNAKELFKFVLVDKATRLFRRPELNMTPNTLPDDDIDKLDEINKSKVRVGNWIYVNEVVNVSQWWRKNGVHHYLVEHIVVRHLDAPNSNSLQECVFSVSKHIDNAVRQNLGNAKFEMLLILAFNKAFIKDMESKNLFTVDNLITLLRSAADATEVATNIIKYFDLDGDVKDDETDEGMEIVAMLKSAAHDVQQQHDANGSATA
ncbi:unnamed protein product [Sphagnum balticum]